MKPLHYAATCISPEPLKLLIDKGANLFDQDLLKRTALHFAAMTGRTENIKWLLEQSSRLSRVRDKSGLSAMAYACKRGEIEPIKAFLDSKQVKVGAG